MRARIFASFFCALTAASFSSAPPSRAEPLGDYGRPEHSAFIDEFLPWLKDGWLHVTGQELAPPFTDDEKLLRHRAYTILLPIEERQRSLLTFAGVDFVELWNLIFNQPPAYDFRSYGNFLMNRAYRSHAARYAQLIDDIRADMGLVGPFFATAGRVIDADAVRRKSFRFVTPALAGEIEVARHRIEENRILIAEVYRRFGERIHSYRYALELLLVMTPSPAAVEAERVLHLLEARFAAVTAPPPMAIVRK